jgi:hypothetical protein
MKYLLPLLLLAPQQDTKVQSGNPIDRIIEAKWKELNITPNPRSSDAEFLRRVTIDLIGTLPEPEEVQAFMNSTDSKKREKKIDELLADNDWAEYWGQRLASIFIGAKERRKMQAIEPLAEFLEEHLKKNTPYDQIVQELLTASGKNTETKSVAFVSAFLFKDRTKKDLTTQVSKLFLGIQLQCAQCHDHPFERYTKDDFYSVAANFAGVNVKQDKDKKELEVIENPKRVAYRPEGYKVDLKPKFIDGTPITGSSIRTEFAKKLVSPENVQFSKATVNRIWSLFTGQGIVEPVDDFSVKNPPSIPELLDELSKGFIDHHYDLKWLMKTITTSKAYQLSSKRKTDTAKEELKKYYAFALVRPMAPEQLFGVLLKAEGVDEAAAQKGGGKGGKRGNAKQLFYRQMADMDDGTPGEYNANIQQIMRMLNMDSPLYAGAKARGRGRLSEILRQTKKPEEAFTQMYLATVSRAPTREELSHCLKYFNEHGGGTSAYEDIFFVLLNTNEFFFNH